MSASPSKEVIARSKRSLERKTGKPCIVLHASNGEVAIVTQEYYDSCYKIDNSKHSDYCTCRKCNE